MVGTGRVPAKGELLRIEMPFVFFGDEEQRRAADTLPQAHTCSNTLELPNYLEALRWRGTTAGGGDSDNVGAAGAGLNLSVAGGEVGVGDIDESALVGWMKDKMMYAALESAGYGLDEL